MIYYQMINEICFTGFIVNIAFLIYLHYSYDIPKHFHRYMFLSLLKNIIGAITQLYVTPLECTTAWYLKSFTFMVFLASFVFCFDIRKVSNKKIQ